MKKSLVWHDSCVILSHSFIMQQGGVMPDHSLKVYAHHLTFLGNFPDLQSWLNCNSFSVQHTHQDFRMQVIYTFWDNHSSEGEYSGATDATESVMVAYCQLCKTVEVSRRCTLFSKATERESVKALEEHFMPAIESEEPQNADESTAEYPWMPSDD